MIRVMGWIPSETALMRCRFCEAIAAFSLQEAVRDATALCDTETPPQDGVDPRANPNEDIATEVGVDPWANPTEAGIAEVEVKSQSSTELIDSDAEAEEIETVEIPDVTSVCAFYELSPADPPSADRCSEVPPRGPPSVDPEGESGNKRRRLRSCLRLLSSPVLRQATALPTDGNFEDYEGTIFPRSASVISPSVEMVAMAGFRAIQCSPMADIRQITACSKRWAAEMPRRLSLFMKEPDLPERQPQPDLLELTAEAVLQAPFGIAALSQVASQALSNLQRAPQPDTVAEAAVREASFEWVSLRRLATMEWLPLPQIADSDQPAPSLTIPGQFSGARQGDLTQGQSSGRVFPFATRDLPGRYDGVGDGRSFAQTRLTQWRRCERPPINRETTFHSIVKIKGA